MHTYRFIYIDMLFSNLFLIVCVCVWDGVQTPEGARDIYSSLELELQVAMNDLMGVLGIELGSY